MVTYLINRQERLVVLRYTGHFTVPKWEAAISKAIAECPEVVTFDSLVDARSPHGELTANEVRDLVQSAKKMGMGLHPRRAVVLTAGLLKFGISRMFEMMGNPESKAQRLTTDSVAKAADWLDRPEALIQAELDALVPTAET